MAEKIYIAGNYFSWERKNILEIYLQDTFEKECEFKIDAEEKEFIKTGVETIVTKLAQKVLQDNPIWRDIEKEMALYESDGGKITKAPGKILKVGSFYEGTKNNFPDEFDMISCFYDCVEETCMDEVLNEHLRKILSLTIEIIRQHAVDFEKKGDMRDITVISVDGKRKIYFDKYIGKSRPAMTISCIYENETDERKEIKVDFVSAAVIKVHKFRGFVNKYCTLVPFGEEIIRTKTILLVHERLTVTQTEVHVMRNLLTENHRKVYRLLKFFIIGNHEDQRTKFETPDSKTHSSYMLKTMVIFHHYNCTNPNDKGLSECMLDILNEICKHKKDDTFPKLLNIRSYGRKIGKRLLLNEVVNMKDQFTSMMESMVEEYKYENYRMKMSINRSFFQKCSGYPVPSNTEDDDGVEDEDLLPLYPIFSEEYNNYLP